MNFALVLGLSGAIAVLTVIMAARRYRVTQRQSKFNSQRENLRIAASDDFSVSVSVNAQTPRDAVVENSSLGGLAVYWNGLDLDQGTHVKIAFAGIEMDAIVVKCENGRLRLRYSDTVPKKDAETLRRACLLGSKHVLEDVCAT
jgi:hypothetical protein